ncbi:hypothetical protein ATO12_01105 [Aquimarina atlantica]|uniref:Uncharacterized protein n=1 Tax=Aquimarina atlantica TaxID=1317122 RepID=A0A023BZC0_9FLAO|nr:hypothetical protein ATO12_01105 [Aquimarina atlantica]
MFSDIICFLNITIVHLKPDYFLIGIAKIYVQKKQIKIVYFVMCSTKHKVTRQFKNVFTLPSNPLPLCAQNYLEY